MPPAAGPTRPAAVPRPGSPCYGAYVWWRLPRASARWKVLLWWWGDPPWPPWGAGGSAGKPPGSGVTKSSSQEGGLFLRDSPGGHAARSLSLSPLSCFLGAGPFRQGAWDRSPPVVSGAASVKAQRRSPARAAWSLPLPRLPAWLVPGAKQGRTWKASARWQKRQLTREPRRPVPQAAAFLCEPDLSRCPSRTRGPHPPGVWVSDQSPCPQDHQGQRTAVI
ncbi:uncharacterized protein LOC123393179 isoform X2 [Mustela putorius furo]|uniref:Uncharacterized protein LOC123393179 isoform X2 n=1 Tax=Mustela putorius furo TaxID=9669 RepID=A0A8U0SC50_MUSPF|nr:uncharacterized protein LOC123393179 isoform X2 [Mustela putorius furo]